MIEAGKNTLQGLRSTVKSVSFAVAAALLCTTTVGCADYRISLAHFVEMQQDAHEDALRTPSAEELQVLRGLLDRQLGPYVVGPSDILLVTLSGLDELALFPPVKVRVDRNGEIDLPLAGAVEVSGLELEDVEEKVRNTFVPSVVRDAVAYVELLVPRQTNVLVRGAVTLPGLVPLQRTQRNLLYAIVGAGGASSLSSGRVTLQRLRRPSQEVTLDLTNPGELRAALALDPLEEGDIITVQAATPNAIFVGGLVNAPHMQTYAPGVEVNILQVLAAAGGLRTDVMPSEGTLVRRMSDGRDAHVRLDFDRIACGRDPNIMLAAGDILWVPHTLETRINDFIQRNIFLRAGVTATYSVTGVEFMNRSSFQSRSAGGGLQDAFDPLGFLTQNAALQTIVAQPAPRP